MSEVGGEVARSIQGRLSPERVRLVTSPLTPTNITVFYFSLLPVPLVLIIGIGCIRALAALHHAGYVHRYVTPYNFCVTRPFTRENLLQKMLITNFSAVLPWPCKPRVIAPFVGTTRYSSIFVHWRREQGPKDDIISLVYVLAEMINGKLPWRSVKDNDDVVCYLKINYPKTDGFKRLPRELRRLYKNMHATIGQDLIDYSVLINELTAGLERLKSKDYKLPFWMDLSE